jgi:hypothetical protein
LENIWKECSHETYLSVGGRKQRWTLDHHHRSRRHDLEHQSSCTTSITLRPKQSIATQTVQQHQRISYSQQNSLGLSLTISCWRIVGKPLAGLLKGSLIWKTNSDQCWFNFPRIQPWPHPDPERFHSGPAERIPLCCWGKKQGTREWWTILASKEEWNRPGFRGSSVLATDRYCNCRFRLYQIGGRNVKGTLGKVERDRTNDIEQWADTTKSLLSLNQEVFIYISKYYSGHPPTDAVNLSRFLARNWTVLGSSWASGTVIPSNMLFEVIHTPGNVSILAEPMFDFQPHIFILFVGLLHW